MKRFVLFAALLSIVSAKVMADNFPFLTFEQTNGTLTTIASTGVTITFNNGNLVATQDGKTTTIALADLNKMYFAETSAVRNLEVDNDSQCHVYSVDGRKIGTFKSITEAQATLKQGIYIVKENGRTYKATTK